jgi:hypothetical protein
MPISPKQAIIQDATAIGVADAIRIESLPKLAEHIRANGLTGGAASFDAELQQFFTDLKAALAKSSNAKP